LENQSKTRRENAARSRFSTVADFVFSHPRATGCVRRRWRWLGCLNVCGSGGVAINEGVLRVGPFEDDDSPWGTRIQIRGPVCFHSTTLFGFMEMMWNFTPVTRKIALEAPQLNADWGLESS
jgi:hypothetical protein